MSGYSEGTYRCNVLEAGISETSNGNPQIVLRIEPVERVFRHPDGNTHVEPVESEYTRDVRLVMSSDNQADYVILKLRHAGWSGQSFSEISSLVGMEVECRNEHREHNDKTYDNFDLVLPPLEQKPLEQSASAGKKLDTLFGTALRQTGPVKPASEPAAQAPAESAPAAAPASSEIPDEEIPF